MRTLGFLNLFVAAFFIAGCASSSDTRRSTEPDYDSHAAAASYGADAVFLGKDQKIRPRNDFQFYFKNCVQTDNRSYYSKTSYWCNDL